MAKRKRKKKGLSQSRQLVLALSGAFLLITLCAGTVAFLRGKKAQEQPPTPPVEQQPAKPGETEAEPQPSVPENPESPPEDFELPEETPPEPISFNKPDTMRAVMLQPGEDFLQDASLTEEEQSAQLSETLDSLEDYEMNTIVLPLLTEKGSVFSLPSIASQSSVDVLQLLVDEARERGLFIYGIYDLSLCANGDAIGRTSLRNTAAANLSEDAFEDFVKSYDLDGILLTGWQNAPSTLSYGDYMAYGAGRSYQDYLGDNARMYITSAKSLVRKYSPSTQLGILTQLQWQPAQEENAADKPSALEESLDVAALYKEGLVDFVAVENYTSTANSAQPYEAAAQYWNTLAQEGEAPVYMIHAADRACTIDQGEGWAAQDQLTRQLITLEDCDALEGSIFNSLSALQANPNGSTTLLMNYYSDNVKKEHILKELAFSKPTQLNISTTDKTYTFQGASDPNVEVLVNGEALTQDENGFFSYTVELQPGANTYTFSHKAKTLTFTINRQVQIIKEVTPEGAIAVDGGMKVTVSAVAYENSSVFVSINGQNYPMSVDETADSEDLRGSSYVRYTGSFTVPSATKSAQKLGNIVVSATWDGITRTMEGASVTVNKLAIVEDGVLVRVTAEQAIVFPTDEIGPYPKPTNFRLPQGTLDYAVGDEVTYKQGTEVRRYYKLASGMRVYSSDISAVSDPDAYVANNSITGMTVTADANYTYVILKSNQPVPFSPDYNSTRFAIDFKYTDNVPENMELTKNPLFSSATWKGSTLTLSLKSQGAFLGYKAYHQDGTIVFRFNNPTGIKGARIVVDPGHGGADNGAPGFNPNYQEKHINWAVAKRLAAELESRGAEVLLLNTINTTMDMDARLAKARDYNAQVYLCVHHNTAPSSSATGTEVYYFYPFAQSLATRMSSAISGALNTNNRGARNDVYYVTRDPQFVGILSEGGFMSNSKEYRKLIDEDYQDAMADAMADAVAAFLKNAGSGNAGISGSQSVGGAVSEVPQEPEVDTPTNSEILAFDESSIRLEVGETDQVSYSLSDDYDKNDLDWSSSDEDVVLVSARGKIRGVAAGTATVTATVDGVSASVKVTVGDGEAEEPEEPSGSGNSGSSSSSAKGPRIDGPSSLEVGDSVRLYVLDEDGEEVDVASWWMYEFSKQFASLSESGKLRGEKAGPITVWATLEDGSNLSLQISITD